MLSGQECDAMLFLLINSQHISLLQLLLRCNPCPSRIRGYVLMNMFQRHWFRNGPPSIMPDGLVLGSTNTVNVHLRTSSSPEGDATRIRAKGCRRNAIECNSIKLDIRERYIMIYQSSSIYNGVTRSVYSNRPDSSRVQSHSVSDAIRPAAELS